MFAAMFQDVAISPRESLSSEGPLVEIEYLIFPTGWKKFLATKMLLCYLVFF